MTSENSNSPVWAQPMPQSQFEFMSKVLSAPSPIGFEAAMSYGIIKPEFESFMPQGWGTHQFKGNASIVFDSHPGRDDLTSVMIVGHADKIRMQVRKIDKDGKVWINTDSFLPTTLIGHEVQVFCQDPAKLGAYKVIKGGTVEALGAIHFSTPAQRTGEQGIKPESIYLELQMHGDDRKAQVEALGLRVGDPILLDRPIKRGVAPDTFFGAYLDNGLGCFSVAEIARTLAAEGLDNVRVLYTIATHEEIGRFGSTQVVGELRPDVLIATDVNHDYEAAPGIGHRNMNPLQMGKGFTVGRGSVSSEYLVQTLDNLCREKGIPMQLDFSGRDMGTDGMAAALAGVDSAAITIGYPIRNMHTSSESAHTGDLLASIEAITELLRHFNTMNDGKGMTRDDLKNSHIRLDNL
ncbi:peptidase M42 [Vibrio sp. UCD-FRSSP16_10]|uniref:M20/M25/M40 family metallo-hydrolase n=1 Tax=unclassified Vibrio TaxID=2614977 RepID=UPI0008016E68|nr:MULTISPECIES: M20/M25/M40 family metallo-hydrolase [unclassified Vibrio]OBT16331.1 peptidase M42 [Vibrio sp. UCD-FRSSP16_30]OBT21196.1 peptidase M42 [Vibrio sp. UCD-FRSSP16_10]